MFAYNTVAQRAPMAAPANMLPVQVVRREILMDGVVRLSLTMPGTIQAPASYLPGQFITLGLPMQRQILYRSYSLCGNGRPDYPWVITVKRQYMGVVSTYLYDHVREGMVLYASRPRGTFILPANLRPGMPLIFVAAGSGITPIIGILSALALLPPEYRPHAQLHYASRSPAETIYLRELEALDPQSRWLRRWYYFSSQGTRLTPQRVLEQAGHLARHAHWYICGPEALKRQVLGLLKASALPEHRVHVETFVSPAAPLPVSSNVRQYPGMAGGTGVRLRVADTGAVLHVQPNETLLAALERHGYRPDFSCRAGACGTCKLRLLSGTVEPVGEALSAAERRAGYVLSCVDRPRGDITIASAGQAPTRGAAFAAASGYAASRRQAAIRRVRMLTLVGVFGLFVGFWGLTLHRASSTPTTSAASSSSQSPASNQQGTSSGSSSSGSSSSTLAPVAPVPNTQSGTS
jgi:ferredoxin-NADP reductase